MNSRLLSRLLVLSVLFLSAMSLVAGEIKHQFLATDESGKQLLYVDEFEPANDWTITIGNNRDIQLVGTDTVLVNTSTGYREYAVKTGKLLKEVTFGKNIKSVVRTADGNTLLASPSMIWELDKEDKEISAIPLDMGRYFRLLRLSRDGTFLYTGGETLVKEADRTGKVLRTIDLTAVDPKSRKPYFMMELKSKNLLISTGFGASLLELDPEGKLVRKIGGRDSVPGLYLNFFGEAEELANGNFIVANWTGHARDDSKKGPQIVEFDKAGKIVWQWHDPVRAGSLHGIAVIR